MTRRTHIGMLAAAALAVSAPASGEETNSMKEILEASMNQKKGVMIYMKGQSIGGGVTKITGDLVELRSQQYSRIVVRMDAIDAVAMS